MNKMQRVTRFSLVSTVVFFSFFWFYGCENVTASEKVYQLKYPVAARGLIGNEIPTIKRWMDNVEKASNGRVKFKVLVGAITDFDAYDALIAGAGDVTSNLTPMSPGRFPIMELMTMPDIGTTCKRVGQVAWDFWKMHPQEIEKEFSEIQLLGFWAASPAPYGLGFGTIEKPVRSLEDMKGLKIGQASEFGIKIAAALGMAPVPVPPPAVYENLQRKIIDGTFMDPEMLDAFKLSELLRYYHNVNFQFMAFWFGMNKKSWKKLPADIQKILQDEAAKIPGWADEYNTKAPRQAIKSAAEKYGLQVVDIPDSEIEKWRELQDPVQQEFLDRLKKKYPEIDVQKLFDDLNALYKKYDQ